MRKRRPRRIIVADVSTILSTRFDMAHFISREGVWDVSAGSRSQTPVLRVTELAPGSFLKVTCNFCAHAAARDSGEGFYYTLGTHGDDDVLAMTPATGVFQGDDGWQTCTLV